MNALLQTDQLATVDPARSVRATWPVPRRTIVARRDRSFPVALLVLGDVAALTAAVLIAGAPLWALALVPATLTALTTRGLYRPRGAGALDIFGGVLTSASIAAGALLLAAATVAPSVLPAAPLAHAWSLACGLLLAHRGAVLFGRRGSAGTPVVILGGGEEAAAVERTLLGRPESGLRPVAVIDVDLTGLRRMDDARILAELARDAGGHDVIVLPGSASDEKVAMLARACTDEGLGLAVRSGVSDAGGALAIEQVGPVSLVRVRPVEPTALGFAVKHASDRLVAGLALLAIAPVFLGLALAVRLSSHGPVLFRQRRVGRDGREFDMLKFRSMRPAEPASDTPVLLPADAAPGGVEGTDRRTRIGTLMRRASLDELPQLLNVVRGDMSLVGPRPERPEFVDRFSRDINRYGDRHRLKSGMTGLAQVNGLRGKTSIRDRVAYDNHYVEHWTPWLDVKILLKTVQAVLQPAE